MTFFGNTVLGYQNTIREHVRYPIDHSKTYLPKIINENMPKEPKPETSWYNLNDTKKYRCSKLPAPIQVYRKPLPTSHDIGFFHEYNPLLEKLPWMYVKRYPAVKSETTSPIPKYCSTNSGFCVVYVTIPTKATGLKIAHSLVSNKLAACANIIPNVTSVYMWKSNVAEDSEELLMIKTQKKLLTKLEKVVKSIHPYDVPKIITVDISDGSKVYLDWIKCATKD